MSLLLSRVPPSPPFADAGAYVLTGADALLGQSAVLAEAGAYSSAGSDADLLTGFRIDADAGSYLFVGSAISELFTMFAQAGSYELHGGALTSAVQQKFKRVPWVTDKPERRARSWPRSGSRYPKKWP